MKTIAWDIDDVLNDLMKWWLQNEWLKEYPNCKLTYEEITENPPHRLLKITLDEYLVSLDKFRLSDTFQEMPPVNEVFEWFKSNGHKYRHIAITSVPYIAVSQSAKWLFKNYGKWIRTFHFVPSDRKGVDIPRYDNNKGEFLKWLSKVDLFVDDNKDNIVSAERVGIKTLLMPRPWNNSSNSINDMLSSIEEITNYEV